jgi:hypothetical protein
MRRNTHAATAAAIAAFGFGLAGMAWAEDPKPKKPRSAPSICRGLDANACASNAVCAWYKEVKLKSGKMRKAHCRKKPVHVAKKTSPT